MPLKMFGFVPRLMNNLFQAKFKGAGIEASRFLINSTMGVGGLFDPATYVFNLETPPEDAGQTLGVYGTNPGPYIVFPFLGPFHPSRWRRVYRRSFP